MKKKAIKVLHTKSISQLEKAVEKTQGELVRLRVDMGAGKLKDTQAVKKARRDLARTKTVLREKELAGAAEKKL